MTQEPKDDAPQDATQLADGLEGWQATDGRLTRHLVVNELDAQALGDGLRALAAQFGRELDVQTDSSGITLTLGADRNVDPADMQVIAEIDRAISGTSDLPGSQDAG